MPLNLRASDKVKNFKVPVSYRISGNEGKFLDARNVNSIQDRLDTRFGSSRYNAEPLAGNIYQGGNINSVTYFNKTDGSQYVLAKVGDVLRSVSATESLHPLLLDTLDVNSVHRAVTLNDRHIIALGSNGLFAWNGTIMAGLGQVAPNIAPSVAAAAGGTLISGDTYKVAITFYASSIGLESNYTESGEVQVSGGNLSIAVSGISSGGASQYVDKIYIYLKNVTTDSEYLFVDEINLGTTTYTISEDSLSSQTPPTTNGPAPATGKYLAVFNRKLVVYGMDEFPNEGWFSEEDLPDAFDDSGNGLRLVIPGRGAGTGLAVGLFSDSVLDPFLVFFKRKSTHIYSEIGGQPKFVTISDEIGCVSHDTISVKNGVVYFLSEEGWRAISNGRIVSDEQGDAVTLGRGDIDDIFKTSGYIYEVNRLAMQKAFSVYYPTLDQYITWVAEGSNFAYTKAYVYEFDVGGFKPYEFAVPAMCATIGEDSNGRDQVLFGTADGYILKHSILEDKSDVNAAGTEVAINAYAVLPWSPEDGDFDATYNFRELILKAVISDEPLTVKTFIDYRFSGALEGEYDFSDSSEGFVLDEDMLDVDAFGEERAIRTARSDINRVGESLAIGFYQSAIGANMGLVSMQVDSSKNGNRNRSNDNDDLEGGFDADTGTYYPSVSQSVQDAQEAKAAAEAAAALFPDPGTPGQFLRMARVGTGNEYRSGAFELVSDITARDAIPDAERYEGMVAYVLSQETNYQLVGGITNSDWQEFSGSGTGPGTGGTSGKNSLVNSGTTPVPEIGEYVSDASCIIVTYYIYRRTDSGFKSQSGKLHIEANPDAVLNADKWALVEMERSERGGDSGVTFTLDDIDTEKSILNITLDNYAGANHESTFTYTTTILSSGSGKAPLSNNSTTQVAAIGRYITDFVCLAVDYYIYRRTDSGFKSASGRLYLEAQPDAATNPALWSLWEASRGERGGDSGVTFSLNDVDTGKSVLEITLDNMAGANHDCTFYYSVTELST